MGRTVRFKFQGGADRRLKREKKKEEMLPPISEAVRELEAQFPWLRLAPSKSSLPIRRRERRKAA
jgi:hypothetical protein